MITGAIKSQIDQVWNAFWSGGISNPLEVIEQITYLLFLRRLDDLHTLEENRAARLKEPMARRVFPKGKDPRGRAFEDLRWSRFKHFAPAEMHTVVADHVFPFLRTLGGDDSTYAHHLKDARFTIPTPGLLAKVVDLLVAFAYLIRARLKTERVDPVFLREFLSGSGRSQLRSMSKTSAGQCNVNIEGLGSLQVPVPPRPLQREFAQWVAEREKVRARFAASEAELDSLFASLQHRAFRGEL